MDDAREDDPSAVAIIFDGSPDGWENDAALAHAIDAVLLFANAFRLLNAGNKLLVVGEHPLKARCLLPKVGSSEPAAAVEPQIVRHTLVHNVGGMIQTELPPTAGGSLVGGALALALCRLAAARRATPRLQLRVLVLHASPDVPGQHLPAMNCAFAAKKLGVIVDAIVLAPSDSPLLQTAADVTGGLYLKPDAAARAGLAQYLLSACLPDQHARQIVRPPAQGKLETRALCYLTKQPVEIGHACSVCLTVYSDPTALGTPPTCPVCGERFVLKPVPKPPPKKKPRPPPPPPQQVRTPGRAARPRRPALTPPAAAASLPQTCALPPARLPARPVAAHPSLALPSQDLSSAAAQAAKEKAEAEEAARVAAEKAAAEAARKQAEEEAARLAAEKAAAEEAARVAAKQVSQPCSSVEAIEESLCLECALSKQPLVKPAKLAACEHPPKCNYDELYKHFKRSDFDVDTPCPCCEKVGRACDVKLDEKFASALANVPENVKKVLVRKTSDGYDWAPASAAKKTKNVDLTGASSQGSSLA